MRQDFQDLSLREAVYADAFMEGKAIDIHKEVRSKNIQIATNDMVLNKSSSLSEFLSPI